MYCQACKCSSGYFVILRWHTRALQRVFCFILASANADQPTLITFCQESHFIQVGSLISSLLASVPKPSCYNKSASQVDGPSFRQLTLFFLGRRAVIVRACSIDHSAIVLLNAQSSCVLIWPHLDALAYVEGLTATPTERLFGKDCLPGDPSW